MFVDLVLRKKKWFLSCSYNTQKSEIRKHLGTVGKNLDPYSSKYENFILLGGFNVEPSEYAMEEFMRVYNLKNLAKGPTYFKSPGKPSCIDLILINDFHKMVMIALKVYFKKKGPSIIQYCD